MIKHDVCGLILSRNMLFEATRLSGWDCLISGVPLISHGWGFSSSAKGSFLRKNNRQQKDIAPLKRNRWKSILHNHFVSFWLRLLINSNIKLGWGANEKLWNFCVPMHAGHLLHGYLDKKNLLDSQCGEYCNICNATDRGFQASRLSINFLKQNKTHTCSNIPFTSPQQGDELTGLQDRWSRLTCSPNSLTCLHLKKSKNYIGNIEEKTNEELWFWDDYNNHRVSSAVWYSLKLLWLNLQLRHNTVRAEVLEEGPFLAAQILLKLVGLLSGNITGLWGALHISSVLNFSFPFLWSSEAFGFRLQILSPGLWN